jgi:hypothetical protein
MEGFTKEHCEELGFFTNTPEDRKDKVVLAINLAIEALIANMLVSDDNQFETMPIPVIIRIVSAVDVPDEDIPRLYHEIRTTGKKHIVDDFVACEGMPMDYESKFMVEIAEEKINYYKNKNNVQ